MWVILFPLGDCGTVVYLQLYFCFIAGLYFFREKSIRFQFPYFIILALSTLLPFFLSRKMRDFSCEVLVLISLSVYLMLFFDTFLKKSSSLLPSLCFSAFQAVTLVIVIIFATADFIPLQYYAAIPVICLLPFLIYLIYFLSERLTDKRG